jgi:hypothetical protein
MIEEFPPKLLRAELGSAMNRASVHQLSIKYLEDSFASLRRLQEYIIHSTIREFRQQESPRTLGYVE